MRENDPDRACGATFGASYRNTKCLYEHAKRMCTGASDTDMVVLVSRGLGGGDQRVSATADYPANPWAKLAMRFGGSNAIDKMAGLDDFDQHTGLYVLAGKCNAPAGWSVERGLEQVLTTEIEDLTGTSRRASVLFPNVGQHFVRSTQPDPVTNFMYDYDYSLTPRITAMSRQSATTAGGTTVLIDGTLFDQGNVSVSLSGVTCATEFASIGEYRGKHLCEWDGVDCSSIGVQAERITCLTNPWDEGSDPFLGDVSVHVSGSGFAWLPSNESFSYIDLWSKKTSWGGNPPPIAGDSVVVPPNVHLVLDVSPPPLVMMTVYGTLEFSRTAGNLALNCSYIIVYQGGRIVIGTEEEPFENEAVITLTGSRIDAELPVYGAKVLAVRGGSIDFHGKPTTSWARLAADVGADDWEITLDGDIDWVADRKSVV